MSSIFKLSKYIVKNAFNHEFNGIIKDFENKLNLNIPKFLVIPGVLIYQYTFIFLILLVLYSFRNTNVVWILLLVSIIFNIILPTTIARCESGNILRDNPAASILRLGSISEANVTRIISLSELGIFWIHNVTYESITIWLLFIEFKTIGIVIGITWIFLVSAVYLLVLQRQSINKQSMNPFILIIINFLISIVSVQFILTIFFDTLPKYNVGTLLKSSTLRNLLPNYVHNIQWEFYSIIHSNLFIFEILLFGLTLSLLYIIGNVMPNNLNDGIKNLNGLRYYVLSKLTNNIFVHRDIRMVDNIIEKLILNKIYLYLPNGLLFLVSIFAILLIKHTPVETVEISMNFIFWVVVVQSGNLLVRNIPVLHLDSELKNIDLITLSKQYFIKDLQIGKYLLLLTYVSPLLIIMVMEKIFLIAYGGNIIYVLLGLIFNTIAFFAATFISLRWTWTTPKFTWENIFSIRQENFDKQILQQLFAIPNRLITSTMAFCFLVVNMITYRHISLGYMGLYYGTITMIITLVITILWKREKNENISRDQV